MNLMQSIISIKQIKQDVMLQLLPCLYILAATITLKCEQAVFVYMSFVEFDRIYTAITVIKY